MCIYSNADQLSQRSTISNQNTPFPLKDCWLKPQPSAQLFTAFAVKPLRPVFSSSLGCNGNRGVCFHMYPHSHIQSPWNLPSQLKQWLQNQELDFCQGTHPSLHPQKGRFGSYVFFMEVAFHSEIPGPLCEHPLRSLKSLCVFLLSPICSCRH